MLRVPAHPNEFVVADNCGIVSPSVHAVPVAHQLSELDSVANPLTAQQQAVQQQAEQLRQQLSHAENETSRTRFAASKYEAFKEQEAKAAQLKQQLEVTEARAKELEADAATFEQDRTAMRQSFIPRLAPIAHEALGTQNEIQQAMQILNVDARALRWAVVGVIVATARHQKVRAQWNRIVTEATNKVGHDSIGNLLGEVRNEASHAAVSAVQNDVKTGFGTPGGPVVQQPDALFALLTGVVLNDRNMRDEAERAVEQAIGDPSGRSSARSWFKDIKD